MRKAGIKLQVKVWAQKTPSPPKFWTIPQSGPDQICWPGAAQLKFSWLSENNTFGRWDEHITHWPNQASNCWEMLSHLNIQFVVQCWQIKTWIGCLLRQLTYVIRVQREREGDREENNSQLKWRRINNKRSQIPTQGSPQIFSSGNFPNQNNCSQWHKIQYIACEWTMSLKIQMKISEKHTEKYSTE